MKNLKQHTNGIWKLRLRVPTHLKDVIGKHEFKKSLGRCGATEAERKAHPILNQWHSLIAQAKNTVAGTTLYQTYEKAGQDSKDRQSDHEDNIRIESQGDTDLAEFNIGTDLHYIKEAALVVCERSMGLNQPTSMPEPAIEDFIEKGAISGHLVETERHLNDYKKIELSSLKSRTTRQIISHIKLQFAKRFPIIHPATINSVKAQNWVDSYYLHEKPPATETMNKYIRSASGYFDWLIRRGYTNIKNPLLSVKLPRTSKKGQTDKRKPFTDNHLSIIYSAMLKKKKCDSILEVIFLIACYTGCRIEEICQLRCTDVHTYEYNNKHRFYLKLAVSKTDKGIGREIPIHSSIHVIIGALKFRKQTNDFLILDGSATSDGERSSKFGKRFGRLKSKLGFGSEHVFHSIRRTFVDQLLANNVDERIAADIVGHEISTMTYGLYGSGTPIDQRFAVVDGISYPKLEKLMKK